MISVLPNDLRRPLSSRAKAEGSAFAYLGARLDTHSADSWLGALLLMVVGGGLFELTRRHFSHQWGEIQEQIERDARRRENG